MDWFRTAAAKVVRWSGDPAVFALACFRIIAWAASGPIFGFSDTWQLIVNTTTTVITFLMVFLIQNSQTRDSDAMHLKLDELLRAIDAAETDFIDLEERSEEEIRQLHVKYTQLAAAAKKAVEEKAGNQSGRKAASSRDGAG